MTVHRFYASVADGRAKFSRAQAHQIRHVLRLRDGEQVAVFDGAGGEWLAQVNGESAEICRPVETPAEPETQLTLFQALIKPARFEWVLQKGTELGIVRFVPFLAERSVASGEKPSRWRSIVVEAAEQSRRRIVPDVAPALSFEDAIAEATREGVPFMPWEGVERPKLSSVHRPARKMTLIIGPEGGFSEAEVERARSRGAVAVSLGRRILRSETAAIVGATLLLHLNGEL
ncbi:MAG TPA: RsmE family RNA methyltransferase [Chloroflexota bacterium]|nr:RsmE family RNA methyltransferase [Chloroflexota bacterium]